jgi:hypothetical protein
LAKLLDGQSYPAQEFLVRQQQIHRQGGINLYEHGVFSIADKGFDTRILLDFLEENLNLPALFVDVGDSFGHESEVLGQKFVAFAAFRIAVTDATQAQGFLVADDLYDVVAGNAGFAFNRAALQKCIHCVLFEASHEENAFFAKEAEPELTDKAFVKDNDGAFRQLQRLGNAAFMGFGIGDGDKSRNRSVMIKESVHFDATLFLAKRGPREKRQAQFDSGGVQTEQLGLETELVFGRMGTAQTVHFCEQVFEKAHGPGIVGIGNGGTGHAFQTPMVQAVSGSGQAA